MYNEVKLSRPSLAIDSLHDGRHALSHAAIARESIPYLIHLPQEGLATFTYTWVNGAGEAGAAFALFGPGVGDQPIQQKLPDRLVSDDMNFSDWQIEKFSMQQDLKFKDAKVRWETPEASIDFEFSALHPPYAYGSNKDGCPPYAATDRVEQSGRVKGTLELNGKTVAFDTVGHRDHSWGTRVWSTFQYYNWFQGQSEDGAIAVHYWRFFALGREHLRGYVLKDGLMAEVVGLQTEVVFDDKLQQQTLMSTIVDDAGRTTELRAEFYAHYTLLPVPETSLREGAAKASYDGAPGVGWMEVGWPTQYLELLAESAKT